MKSELELRREVAGIKILLEIRENELSEDTYMMIADTVGCGVSKVRRMASEYAKPYTIQRTQVYRVVAANGAAAMDKVGGNGSSLMPLTEQLKVLSESDAKSIVGTLPKAKDLSVSDAAGVIGKTYAHTYQLVKRGKLPSYRIAKGCHYRVKLSDALAYVNG